MGKLKRERRTFHETSIKKPTATNQTNATSSNESKPMPILPLNENIFKGLNISLDNLKKNLSDDVRSVKSFKSTTSTNIESKQMSKRNKMKLRHEVLLQKIDSLNQQKKKNKQRKKRKSNVIIGDTNALHDALPSLDSLLKSREINIKVRQGVTKKKAIFKAATRKKNMIEGINMYKKLLSNKDKQFKNDPMGVITQHVKQRVQSGDL